MKCRQLFIASFAMALTLSATLTAKPISAMVKKAEAAIDARDPKLAMQAQDGLLRAAKDDIITGQDGLTVVARLSVLYSIAENSTTEDYFSRVLAKSNELDLVLETISAIIANDIQRLLPDMEACRHDKDNRFTADELHVISQILTENQEMN